MEAQYLRAFYDLASWIRLAPLLNGPYLPFSAWSLRPGALVKLLDDIALNDRKVIVECGSGTSTIVFARYLAERGHGNVLSLEHDEKWATWVDRQLTREGLGDVARVVHAPLAEHPAAVKRVEWYEPDTVTAEVGAFTGKHGPVELLLVDGPPGWEQDRKMARYPAVPVLKDLLAPGASVMLDDVNRSEGVEITKRWADECGLRMDLDPYGTRTAFGTYPG
ncbi:class I SAM-dependent methyltransferase [Streptomyces sp. DH24]|uniref:class I SAM-dependent methyltransferase n=1 Tax=Streptomyces sp. DH24 TaxID=3040123 RepID=UPI0024410B3B|nr:class I SAM-dependent methyltransferase [Streptomyces sp. DH24]MDG9715518.1 class I SAM-dependent methyltransferase [Streptomyces sp. DH24]